MSGKRDMFKIFNVHEDDYTVGTPLLHHTRPPSSLSALQKCLRIRHFHDLASIAVVQ